MTAPGFPVILGSRSPRRRELLALLVPAERIAVLPPRSAEEPGFDDLFDRGAILARLRAIARAKSDDVIAHWRAGGASPRIVPPPKVAEGCDAPDKQPADRLLPTARPAVVTADTIILAEDAGGPVVLGQPPEDDGGETIRRWFREHLFGKTHEAITALCVRAVEFEPAASFSRRSEFDARRSPSPLERTVSTRVTFGDRDDELLEWYIATGEPFGKAGAYGIQGAGSLFATRVEGSLSNVVGLPLEALRETFAELDRSPCDL